MTATIYEITDTLYQVIDKYKKNEDCWESYNSFDGKVLKPEYVIPFRNELVQAAEIYFDDLDDWVTTFAELCACVVRYDLVEREDWTYYDALRALVDSIIEAISKETPADCVCSDSDNTEAINKIKQLMLDVGYIVVYSGYGDTEYLNKLYDLYNRWHCSFFALHIFCWLTCIFFGGKYIHTNHIPIPYLENFDFEQGMNEFYNEIRAIYSEMNNDFQDYVFGINGYFFYPDSFIEEISDRRFLPFLGTGSIKGVSVELIINQYNEYCQDNRIDIRLLRNSEHASDADKIKFILSVSSFHDLFKVFTLSQSKTYCGLGEIVRGLTSTERNLFMHMPLLIPSHSFLKELLDNNMVLDKAMADREELIRGFSHRFKNMRTTSLHNVAKALLAMDNKELKKWGRTVLLEYGVKENIIKEVEMLRLRYEDNQYQLLTLIRESESKGAEGCNSIADIVNKAIARCVTTLVHDGSDEPRLIRTNCFKGYDLISLRNSFEEKVLFAEQPDTIAWLHQHIMPVTVSFSDSWKKLYFKKERGLDIILTDLMTDLIMNDFKYADKSQTVRFNFKEDQDFLIIETENKSVTNKDNIPGSNTGLRSQAEFISYLNSACGYKDDSLLSEADADGSFRVEIKMSRLLFMEDHYDNYDQNN